MVSDYVTLSRWESASDTIHGETTSAHLATQRPISVSSNEWMIGLTHILNKLLFLYITNAFSSCQTTTENPSFNTFNINNEQMNHIDYSTPKPMVARDKTSHCSVSPYTSANKYKIVPSSLPSSKDNNVCSRKIDGTANASMYFITEHLWHH